MSQHDNVKAAEFLRAESELVLDEKRKRKAEKFKAFGNPVELNGVPIDMKIVGNYAWLAENTSTIRKLDLETGRTVKIFRGHSGPVTALAFCDMHPGSGDRKVLISGSWDMTIKLWNTDTGDMISSTPAHADFVKTLLVVPQFNLLLSGSSDKSVRFWDLSSPLSPGPLPSVGSLSSHTRPVQCLAAHVPEPNTLGLPALIVFTADTMGVIRVWDFVREEEGGRYRWKHSLRDELKHHRTGINELLYANEHLWTASTDETIQILHYPLASPTQSSPKVISTLKHTTAFKAILPLPASPQLDADSFPYVFGATGDLIKVYNVSSLDEPELLTEVEGHWHDVTHLRLWLKGKAGRSNKELWIVSTGLDKTIRRWKMSDMLISKNLNAEDKANAYISSQPSASQTLTEEEERELAELMSDDDI